MAARFYKQGTDDMVEINVAGTRFVGPANAQRQAEHPKEWRAYLSGSVVAPAVVPTPVDAVLIPAAPIVKPKKATPKPAPKKAPIKKSVKRSKHK